MTWKSTSEGVLAEAFLRLSGAVNALGDAIRDSAPRVPRPRPPSPLHICRDTAIVIVPNGWNTLASEIRSEDGSDRPPVTWGSSDLQGRWLASHLRYQPRLVLRAVRRIESLAAWCDARAIGLRRASEEILRQQASAVETLESSRAMQIMATGGGSQ